MYPGSFYRNVIPGIIPNNRNGNNYLKKSLAICLCFLSIQTFAQCLKDLTDTQPIVVSTFAEDAWYPGSDAFDNGDGADYGWMLNHNPEPGNECWIRVYFSSGAQVVKGYSITSLDDYSGNTDAAPSAWQLQGSNNGTTWTVLDNKTAQAFSAAGETHIYSFNNANSYSYYRLVISQTMLASATWAGIAELQLFSDVCLNGTVFVDNGDRASAFNVANDVPLAGVSVSIVTSPVGNVVASTTTNASGYYLFNAAAIPASGSFSVIVAPQPGKIFVTHPANLWSTWLSFPSAEEEPPTGAVFFDYYYNTVTNSAAAVNRMRYAGGNLDFGLKNAVLPAPFGCSGSSPANLIVEANSGTFGTSSYTWTTAHPHQESFSYASNILYSSMPVESTSYVFNNTSGTSANRGVLLGEGRYAITSFPGTLSDIAYKPYTNSTLNNVLGGWRKSYGTTTGDANDRFLAVNGATAGSLPFFKQTNLTLTPAATYTLAFYCKHANSYVQVTNGIVNDAQIVVEVLDGASTVVTSGSLDLSRPTGYVDDRPEAPWQLRFFSFTAPGSGGPFTVQLRASTVAAAGNDFYVDNIVLYPCMASLLPLQLVNFTAQNINNDVQLNWDIKEAIAGITEVQHSLDGKKFDAINFSNIEAAVERYNYLHRKVGAGTHYYRLKITDANNRMVYSAIKKINVAYTDNKYITIYPNPAADKIFITANSISEATIMDASGKLLKTFKNINASQLQINIEQFTAGVYYIKLVQKNKLTLHKFIVKK